MASTPAGDDTRDQEPQKLNRRLIYLHRLVGDDVRAPRTKSSRHTSWRVVARFLVYAFVAVFTITSRTQVFLLSQVNTGIETGLRGAKYTRDPVPKYFGNVSTIDDVMQWIKNGVLSRVRIRNPVGQPFSFLSYNRVLISSGVCPEAAALTLTLRRVRTSSDSAWTTSDRFKALYPETWVAQSLPAGASGTDIEATETLTSTNEAFSWVHSGPCLSNCQTQDNSRRSGYRDQGGYIAMLVINQNGTWVHLVDNNAELRQNEEQGLCEGMRVSSTLTLDEFLEAGFLDSQFGSLALVFKVYNANLQTMSMVEVLFDATCAGLVASKNIAVQTLRLDIYDELMRWFELGYLAHTGVYFFEFVYGAYKYTNAVLHDIWTYLNLFSIVASLTSLTLWLTYMPELATFVQSNQFEYPAYFENHVYHVQWFIRCGSCATLTIGLRLLKYLGDVNTRVKLLLRTMGNGAKNMAIYVFYIAFLFAGFTVFALTRFSSTSSSFTTPSMATLSTFSMMFGDLEPVKAINSGFRVPFFVLFMLCFYIVSLQMFNAIINYSYNMVSEQMMPEFEQEEREARRKEIQRAMQSKNMLHTIRDFLQSLTNKQKPEDAAATAKEVVEVESPAAAAAENDDIGEKIIKHKDKKKKSPDGPLRIFLFATFACCYLIFLQVNLNISDSQRLNSAITGAVKATEVTFTSSFGQVLAITFDQISTKNQLGAWISTSLDQIVFNTTSAESLASALALGIRNEETVCIAGWNCLLMGPGYSPNADFNASNSSTPVFLDVEQSNFSLVRITQRRARIVPNDGCAFSNTPTDQCFSGGQFKSLEPNSSNASSVLVKDRISPSWQTADSSPGDWEERNIDYQLALNERPFCKSSNDGGYRQYGGIVCLMNADYYTFKRQLSVMMNSSFITKGSNTFVVDFATYNGNTNTLTYVVLDFVVLPSGLVEKRLRVNSMKLFDFADFFDNWASTIERILPGIVYMCLTIKFAWDLYMDLRQDIYRKWLNENRGRFRATVQFITTDIFNLLELISILISFISFVLFIMWLSREGELAARLDGPFNSLLDYCQSLVRQARLYNQLSAINMLLICIRPLKFVRESVRMAQLYQTLGDAQVDIYWFVCMFLIALGSFVAFAHISFGPMVKDCNSLSSTFRYCWMTMLGKFDYGPLGQADPIMAVLFFVAFLFFFNCVFLNVFFAIIDRYFVAADPPPFNIKRYLKPFFKRLCRCIEWDEDYVMEQEQRERSKGMGPSRQTKVKNLCREINMASAGPEGSTSLKNSKVLSDVCDVDEKMQDVLRWSKEEANQVVQYFHVLLHKKQAIKNDENFIKNEVMKQIKSQATSMREDMREAERLMRYATKVHEQMAHRDQETLAKYILILEFKIRNKMKQRHELEREVRHLRGESDKMRFTHEELNQSSAPSHVRQNDRLALEDKDGASDDSDDGTLAPAGP